MGRLIRAPRDAVAPLGASAPVAAEEGLSLASPEERQRFEAEARRKGFEAGHAEGRRQAEAECLSSLVAARVEAAALLSEARKAAVPLAVRMAERIVGREVTRDPSVLLDLLGQAVRATGVTAGPIELRVHPEDARLIEAQRPDLAAKLGSGLLVRWVLDEAVGRTGCIVETRKMRLDARLETQLDVLATALLGAGTGTRGASS